MASRMSVSSPTSGTGLHLPWDPWNAGHGAGQNHVLSVRMRPRAHGVPGTVFPLGVSLLDSHLRAWPALVPAVTESLLFSHLASVLPHVCLLYTSDAADEDSSV